MTKQNEIIESEYSKIFNYYVDLYIVEHVFPLYGNVSKGDIIKIINERFNALLLYINRHINKPNYDNLLLLNDMFYSYVELCFSFNRLPTIQGFSFISGINKQTIYKWKTGYSKVSLERMEMIKNWFDTCKDVLVDDLSNSDKTSVNKIFVAKSVYGLQDSANVISDNGLNEIQVETLPTLAISNKENEND